MGVLIEGATRCSASGGFFYNTVVAEARFFKTPSGAFSAMALVRPKGSSHRLPELYSFFGRKQERILHSNDLNQHDPPLLTAHKRAIT